MNESLAECDDFQAALASIEEGADENYGRKEDVMSAGDSDDEV